MSDASLLDDVARQEQADPAGMLRAVASGAAQVREAVVLADDAGVRRLAEDGRPRAVVVCGDGPGGVAGDVLAAIAGGSSAVPVVVHRGFGLPAWVGPVDVVAAVDSAGTTPETLSALEQGVRRGCRLLTVGAAGSPLADLGERGRAVHVAVPQGRPPRTNLWSLALPLVLAGDALGLLHAPAPVVAATATALEDVADRCRVDAASLVNPAKRLALEFDGALPLLWASSPLTAAAAYRFACQLHESARVPAMFGSLPEIAQTQLAVLDGPLAAAATGGGDDFFRDRSDDQEPALPLVVVLLREVAEHPQVARAAQVSAALARDRGLAVVELHAEGASPLERLASIVGLTDFASTYLALLQGTDPAASPVVRELAAATTAVPA